VRPPGKRPPVELRSRPRRPAEPTRAGSFRETQDEDVTRDLEPAGEERIVGVHACQAFAAHRPDDVLRVYLTEEMTRVFGSFLHRCAELRRPYRVVATQDLERLSKSTHHEGICIFARLRERASLEDILAVPGPGWLVATNDVGNPHNVGAILRSAAHFGARAVLLGGAARILSAAAYRTAQGGAEYVDALPVPDLDEALGICQAAGFAVCATSSHEGRELYGEPLPSRTVLLFGAEGEGLSPAALRASDRVIKVPGTGHVESLNVSVTVGVLLAELWRQHGPRRGAR